MDFQDACSKGRGFIFEGKKNPKNISTTTTY
jgi:hypothetical protein